MIGVLLPGANAGTFTVALTAFVIAIDLRPVPVSCVVTSMPVAVLLVSLHVGFTVSPPFGPTTSVTEQSACRPVLSVAANVTTLVPVLVGVHLNALCTGLPDV